MQVPVERIYILEEQRQIDPAVYADGAVGTCLIEGSLFENNGRTLEHPSASQGQGLTDLANNRIGNDIYRTGWTCRRYNASCIKFLLSDKYGPFNRRTAETHED